MMPTEIPRLALGSLKNFGCLDEYLVLQKGNPNVVLNTLMFGMWCCPSIYSKLQSTGGSGFSHLARIAPLFGSTIASEKS